MDLSRPEALIKRLDSYWRMEAINIGLVPIMGLIIAWPHRLIEAAVVSTALIACCLTLRVGAGYWRAVCENLRDPQWSMAATLDMAMRWRPYCLAAAIFSAAVSVTAIAQLGLTRQTGVAALFTVLALLEYVNYYHRQLQNFDHGPTFGRFLRSRSFPRAHLAKALENYQKCR
ncbi:MAG: hypothetical protein ABIT16_00515 [Croceibacterium sp.]